MNYAKALLAVAGSTLPLSACGSRVDGRTASATEQNISAAGPQGAKPIGSSATGTLGVNLNTIQWNSRAFMNLIYGSTWNVQDSSGAVSDVPADALDGNGWVKSAPAGARILRALAAPLNASQIVCSYQGNGLLSVAGSPVSNVTTAPGSIRFSLAATYGATLSYSVDPANYIRNIDCREANAAAGTLLTPEFASSLSVFKTLRFMKWQTATEGNWPVTWATRNKPGDGDYTKNDGVPVEVMVQVANETGADLWVTMPWNADNDYIKKFASYVRDKLGGGQQVYVEVSNEVWNGAYAVSTQANNEAIAENLPSANGSGTGGRLERYAEKTKQVMAIWSVAFSGQGHRLVRVGSFQHVSPYFSDLLLNYMDLSKSVDALATAPYFGYEATDAMSLEQIMTALPSQVTAAVDVGVKQKAVAQKYGLRYLTYEAGQSVVLSNVALEQQVERDSRMHDAYQQFMSEWQSRIGGGLNLFALEGPISQYGAWGLSEYAGQPISQAPKLRAVYELLGKSKPPKTLR